MRCYDDPVEVRKGLVDRVEGPEQFVWRGRLWQVRAVVGRWVETAPWWEHRAVRGLLGSPEDTALGPEQNGAEQNGAEQNGAEQNGAEQNGAEPDGAGPDGAGPDGTDRGGGVATSVAALVAEQEVWRVDATRGRLGVVCPDDREVRGVFDLVLDTGTGWWRLTGCQD